MIFVLILFTLISTFPLTSSAVPVGIARTINTLESTLYSGNTDIKAFDITATAASECSPTIRTFAIEDPTGTSVLRLSAGIGIPRILAGEIIHAKGIVSNDTPQPFICTNVAIIGHGQLKPLEIISVKKALDRHNIRKRIRVKGIVQDAFLDEIDAGCFMVAISQSNALLYAYGPAKDVDPAALAKLIGKDVVIEGVRLPNDGDIRTHIKTFILLTGPNAVKEVSTTNVVPTIVPDLAELHDLLPAEITSRGRHRATGTVLVGWNKDNILLETEHKTIVNVQLAKQKLPPVGSAVTVTGLPETDLYRANLTHATWEPGPFHTAKRNEEPSSRTIAELIRDGKGRARLDYRLHGSLIRIKGIVKTNSDFESSEGQIILEDNGSILSVDDSSCKCAFSGIPPESIVEIVGICIMETECWRPNLIFPHIKKCLVAIRSPNDVKILSLPPYWTAKRLLVIVCTLLATLFVFLAWNTLLHRTVARRSAELEKEIIARISSDLKVYERTRLAVELHDSVAQNLTGISLELRAAKRMIDLDKNDLRFHLDLATKTLDSCRGELRNCLWDLRNLSLDNTDMNDAIRQTIRPHLEKAKATIRFNVPRDIFCDNTLHTVLRIIRELVINSIRHGQASALKIAGIIEGNRLMFSVSDNGIGFDPKNCPGMEQGHFGIQGIRERIDVLEGEMSILSKAGCGTKTTIAIKLSNPREEKDKR